MVIIGAKVNNILFFDGLFFVGSTAHSTSDDVCTGGLMVTRAVAAIKL